MLTQARAAVSARISVRRATAQTRVRKTRRVAGTRHTEKEEEMLLDGIVVLVTLAMFLALIGFTFGCERL